MAQTTTSRSNFRQPSRFPFRLPAGLALPTDVEGWIRAVGLAVIAVFIAFAPLAWPLLVAGAILGGVLLLRHPWVVWVVFAIFLPWTSSIRLGPVSGTDALFLLAVVLWFINAVRQGRVWVHISAPAIAALIYAILLYTTSFLAVDLAIAVVQQLKWLQFAVVLLILPTMIRAEDHVSWLVSALFLGASIQAALGIYQFYFGVGPAGFMIQDTYMRASGSFGQPNPFGGYLGLTLPVTISVLSWFSVRPLHKRRLHWRDITGWTVTRGLVVLVAAGLLASWSRGAWLGALVATGVVLWFSSTRIVRISAFIIVTTLLLIGAATPLLGLVPPEITARFAEIPMQFGLGASIDAEITEQNFAVLERLAFWLAAVRMWETAPWLGIGPGNYNAVYADFSVPRWEIPLGHAHNIYLNTLAETGIVGLIVFLLLWSVIIRLAYNSYQESRRTNRWQAALSVGILGVIAHLAVHSIFDNLFVQGMFLHLSLWIAILLSLQLSSKQRKSLAKVEKPFV